MPARPRRARARGSARLRRRRASRARPCRGRRSRIRPRDRRCTEAPASRRGMIESTICAAAAPGAYHAEVPRRFTISAAALGGSLDHRLDRSSRDERAQRHAADRRRADDRNHLVAVPAEHHRRRRPSTDAPVSQAMKVREAGGVEHRPPSRRRARAASPSVACDVAHRIERVRDDDQDRVGRRAITFAVTSADDPLVGRHEVVAAHPGRAGEAGGDHDDRRSRRFRRSCSCRARSARSRAARPSG